MRNTVRVWKDRLSSHFSSNRKIRLWTALTIGLSGAAVGLTGCSGGQRSAFEGTGSPRYTGANPIPKGGGRHKVGKPYKIAGKKYYPKVDNNYNKVGIASWYGPKFHKRQTSNGEWFDMESITAAHKTLPMPSFVRVTNLGNGKSLVARLNDRGPYAHDRIIDMSKRSAEILGFRRQGTAKVRVEYIGPAPLNGDDYYVTQAKKNGRRFASDSRYEAAASREDRRADEYTPNDYRNERSVELASASAPEGLKSVAGNALYIQAGSYADPQNAARAKARLSDLGAVETVRTIAGPTVFYRVRVGPLNDPDAANRVLSDVITAGHGDARIIAR